MPFGDHAVTAGTTAQDRWATVRLGRQQVVAAPAGVAQRQRDKGAVPSP